MEKKVWNCKSGSFTGVESSDCINFTGVRYAESERYGPPVPYIYSEGVHDCSTPSPYCIQDEARIEGALLGIHYSDVEQVESCQYLSFTIPAKATPESKLPVMVWYHGGSYKNGGSENLIYDRGMLVREQNIIVVSVNYRLGILGLLRDREGNLANNAILDSIEGLRWVKENIQSFGGDPDNITIVGQSAGADVVRCIVIAEGTTDLYKKCILESPPIGTLHGREDMDLKSLAELNTHPIDVPTEELVPIQKSILSHVTEKGRPKEMVFAPHYGIYPLPEEKDVYSRMQKVSKDHPMLIGSNTREVMAYVGGEEKIHKMYGNPLLRPIIRIRAKKATDDIFRTPTRRFAEDYARSGGETYHYSLHWLENTLLGSCHGCELPLLFGPKGVGGRLEAEFAFTKEQLSEIGRPFRDIWAGFIRDGTIRSYHIEGMMDIERL